MSKRKTYEEIKEAINNKGFELLSTFYIKNSKKLKIMCKIHGPFEVSWNNFQFGHTCKTCNRLAMGAKYAKDPALFEIEVSKTAYKLVTPYVRSNLKVKMQCPEHGIFEILPNDFSQGKGCYKCGDLRGAQKRAKEPPKFLEMINKKGYILLSPYIKTEIKVKMLCPEHGEFNITPHAIIGGQGCDKCGSITKGLKLRKNPKIFEEQVSLTKYELVTPYIKSQQKVAINCQKHGNFEITPSNFLRGHYCPKCSSVISSIHNQVFKYIESIYKKEIINNDRKILNKLELDIYIPEFNFGIEIDGLYWHSELKKLRPDLQNLKKITRIQEKNINFLAIFSDEWENPIKREIIKSMISFRIRQTKETFYGRDLEFFPVAKNEAKKFMEMNHLDGHVQFKESFGLRDKNGCLVMCLTLRTDRSGTKEIARMASLKFVNVVGGASKLIKNIEGPLISYSNNRIGHGNVYKQLGFKEITKTTSPSYYYTDFKKRVWRFKCRKIKGLPGTEREQALNGAFSKHFGHNKPVYRIYDYGHRKWAKID